jgi:hypothetical protein
LTEARWQLWLVTRNWIVQMRDDAERGKDSLQWSVVSGQENYSQRMLEVKD